MIKTINTGVAELVLVKVPEDMNITVSNTQIEWGNSFSSGGVKLPMGNYKLLGIAHDLTEEVWRKIVKTNFRFNIKYNTLFLDYSTMHFKFKTATESGLSLLRANEVYDENPFGKNRPFIYDEDAGTEREHLGYKWDKAQETTGKWVVLKKTNV